MPTTHGSSPASLAVTALHSLADGAWWKSASINFDTNDGDWIELQVKLVTAASGAGDAKGYANVYLAGSNDNSVFDANITPGDAAWSSADPTTAEYAKSLRYLGRIYMGTTSTSSFTYVKTFSFDQPPKYGCIVIEQQAGKDLAASGNQVTYLENTQAA